MCGIIGYSGSNNAVPILIQGLYALEYRGYDSAGISVTENGSILTVKASGRIKETEELLKKEHPELFSNCGIGHTRWATHGEPTTTNSHPHFTERISMVHNGIIENYIEIKERLSRDGIRFASETDTEAAAQLLDIKYSEINHPIQAISALTKELCGSYAFGIIFKDRPGTVYAVKKDSPLIIAKCEHGGFIASDVTAVIKHTNCVMVLSDGEIAEICGNNITIYDCDGNIKESRFEETSLTNELYEKNGFPHFMLKEINEEPEAIMRTLKGRIKDEMPDFALSDAFYKKVENCKRIHIVACGTAMHAGLIGKYFIEKHIRIPVNVEIASEFRYRNPILEKDDIFIALSQSGETADTLAALRLAKQTGLYTLAVVNAPGSSAAREADDVIYTYAGPEIAVASTKAYTVQVCIMYLLAMEFAHIKNKLDRSEIAKGICSLSQDTPIAIRKALLLSDAIKSLAEDLSKQKSIFFIGRGIDSYLAPEASLKLKEIAYISSEAYAAGELKHGTISLITEGTAVVAIITEADLFQKMLSNIKEVKARGANVIVICDENMSIPTNECDSIVRVPHIESGLTCLSSATAFQLLAYYTAEKLGCDIDKPRNLAKSVTVE